MTESRVLGPKTGPERRAGYQTNIPPTACRVWSGLVGMEVELGHSLTLSATPHAHDLGRMEAEGINPGQPVEVLPNFAIPSWTNPTSPIPLPHSSLTTNPLPPVHSGSDAPPSSPAYGARLPPANATRPKIWDLLQLQPPRPHRSELP